MTNASVSRHSRWPIAAIAGSVLAVGITTTMDAVGLSDFSALPLCPLFLIMWYFGRHSRREVGFVQGRARDYAIAVMYPLAAIGSVAVLASAVGAANLTNTDWSKAVRDLLLIALTTIIVAAITEEGFFRGWLWASLTESGFSRNAVIVGTSVIFSLWHLSAVSLDTGFDIPTSRIPVFMVNAALLGAAWGLLRSISGSVFVASASHGVWNGLAYTLFGFGTRSGALGITETYTYGPEVGIAGLVVNGVAVVLLWRLAARTEPSPVSPGFSPPVA